MATYLDRILEAHRRRASEDVRDVDGLVEKARSSPPPRGFRSSLAGSPGICLISEIKRRSPSKGLLAPDLDPAALARSYEAGGATCLSVLTDGQFFGGSPADLEAVRRACALPVLRKDFTVGPSDVCDARIMGADALLLIVAALSDTALSELVVLTTSLGMDALVEVHDQRELERGLSAGASLIGVNQRDLHTFEVDPHRAERVSQSIPRGAVKVAESGIGAREGCRAPAGCRF